MSQQHDDAGTAGNERARVTPSDVERDVALVREELQSSPEHVRDALTRLSAHAVEEKGRRIWFSPHGTEWEAETYVEALEAERDALAARLAAVEAERDAWLVGGGADYRLRQVSEARERMHIAEARVRELEAVAGGVVWLDNNIHNYGTDAWRGYFKAVLRDARRALAQSTQKGEPKSAFFCGNCTSGRPCRDPRCPGYPSTEEGER